MMFINQYSSQSKFPYAEGSYLILPTGLPDRFYSGDGEHVTIGNEVICFKPDTPNEIIKRFVADYTEHLKQKQENGVYCD